MGVFWVANFAESWQVLQKLMTDEFWSDLMRAVAIMVAGPVFLLVLPLAWLKQGLRRRLHAEYGQVTYTHIYIISYTYIILLGMRRRLHPEHGQVTALWIVASVAVDIGALHINVYSYLDIHTYR